MMTTNREISVSIPQGLFDESLSRLRAAGVEDPQELLEAALRASAIDRLETVGGSGPVPTALSDVRSAWLFELCKLRSDILADEVVAVLFRVMPATATAVTRRMQATYEAALGSPLQAHMVANAKLSTPKKEEGEMPRHRVTFATAAAFSNAVKTIAAAGLAGEVTVFTAARAIEFPQKVEVTRGGQKREVQIASQTLGIR
jgi:hypothetical protein